MVRMFRVTAPTTLWDSDIKEIGNECIYAAVVSKLPLDDRLPESSRLRMKPTIFPAQRPGAQLKMSNRVRCQLCLH